MKRKKNSGNRENDVQVAAPEKKKLPGWVILPIIAVLVIVAVVLSKLSGGSGKPEQLTVTAVKKEDIRQVYSVSGTVESSKTKVFYSPVNATIKQCKAEVGKAVNKGDSLIVFDVTNLERDNQQSQLNALSAQYTNEDAKEQSSRAEKNADQAKENQKNSENNLSSQITKKKKEIEKLEKAAKQASESAAENAKKISALQKEMQENLNTQTEQKAAKENAERQLQNLEQSDPEYAAKSEEYLKISEEATNAISQLEKEYRALEQEKSDISVADASGYLTQIAAAEQELEALQNSLSELQNSSSQAADSGLTEGQKKNMEVTENLAELSKKTTEELLEEGKKGIKAEFDGVISDVKALEGSEAVQGGELFTLVSNKNVFVELEVPVNDFDNLVEGQAADIQIGRENYRGELETVDRIALQNEKGNPVIKAKVSVSNPDENIYIGVNAKVELAVAEKKEALCLPIEVINSSTDEDFVYVIRGGEVCKQKITLGIISDSRAEITDGLKEGDEVVADSGSDITEGMKAVAVKE